MNDFFSQFKEPTKRRPYRVIKVKYTREFKKFERRMYNFGLRKTDFRKRFDCPKGIREYYYSHPDECEKWLSDEIAKIKCLK